MKRFFLFALTVCLLISSSIAWAGLKEDIEPDDFVFRRVKWGMTVEEVKQSEHGATDINEGSLRPTDETWNAWVVLYFTSNRLYESPLTEIYYLFRFDPAPPPVTDGLLDNILIKISMPIMGESNPVFAHSKIKKILNIQYGPPEEDEHFDCIWAMPDKKLILRSDPLTSNGTLVTISIRKPYDSNEPLD